MRFSAKTAGLSSALAAPAVALLLNAVPVQAQTGSESPCDSETVVPAGQDALRADCEALWAFYTQLEDPGLLDDEGTGHWGLNTPLSTWHGVTVDQDRVAALALGGNGLSGSIPSELGQLSNLWYLNLNYNELFGSIPSELGQLTRLIYLYLNDNMFEGLIPSELGQLSNLRILDLSTNRLSGSIPSELGQLSNLEALSLGGNGLSGSIPSELSRFGLDRYSEGPMGLIDGTELYREFTVSSEVWDVWLCDTPAGNLDLDPEETVVLLNGEITPYYRWLSNDRYKPRFRYVDRIESPNLDGCGEAVLSERKIVSSNNRFIVIDDSGGHNAHAAASYSFTGKGYIIVSILNVSYVIHEIGHGLGFPHSYGSPLNIGYDNPMDVMSGGFGLATIAVNRYAAGWIDPANVAIHPPGKSHIYELRPPGLGGTQMLVLRDPRFGVMITLGARVARGYDSDIPKEGVEIYKVDQFTRRTQPTPAAETWAELTRHVHTVGDVFEVGTATVEVVERVGDSFTVRVVDSAEPTYAGRFSDEDGSAHEGNIEAIAARGVTLGCSSTYPGLFCPGRVVTRAQMMAFLARALGLEGGVETLTSRFADVSGGVWYSPYLERLADLGVVELYEDGTFRPSEPLTRRDMAVFLTRAFAHISPVAEPAGAFEDVPAGDPGAAEVEAILAAGVTRGCSAEPMRYCPEEPVTRAQMASFLIRALQE